MTIKRVHCTASNEEVVTDDTYARHFKRVAGAILL
jgi:predicted nucleic acid-binding protein